MDANTKQEHPKTPDMRGRKVYPSSLAIDDKNRHVPLHRRGKSKTYERLEDLLREAGYKETRIFTPEAERVEAEARERAKKEMEKTMRASGLGTGSGLGGTVAGILSGLVRRGSESAQNSPNGSKSGNDGTDIKSYDRSTGQPGRTTDTRNPPSPSPNPRSQPTRRRSFAPISHVANYLSQNPSGNASSSSSRSPPHSVRRDARTTLRHMISAPDIPQRRQLLVPSRRLSDRPRSLLHVEHQPPLPSNWLQTVTKAVLGSGPSSGAYVGGPSANRGRSPHIARTPQRTKHAPRNGSFRSVTPSKRIFTPYTPRPYSSPGVVTTASVVCRSTPSSRSSSVCRGLKRGKSSNDCNTCVPSLGVTVVEGDSWPLIHTSPHIPMGPTIHLDSDSDDSDGGELSFARLIVPSKRQHSIQSLRKHLHEDSSSTVRPSALTARPTLSANSSVRRVLKPSRAMVGEDSFDDEALQRSWHQNGHEDADENSDDWSDSDLPGLGKAVKKQRGALPWMPWTTKRS